MSEETVEYIVMKCAICKKNILEDFENIWDHDCYRALDQNLYTFLLNSDNEFEPVLQGEYTNDLKDSDESIMIECDNLQQSSLSLPHMPRILTQPSKSSKSSALGQTENKGKENIKVLEKGKRGRPSKSDELTDDEVTEELIEEVAKEPCLYDFSLPIEQRGEKQRASAWERISRRLGDRWTTDVVKARWNYLRDRFVRTYKEQTQILPTGSGSKKRKPITFKFYESMMFLQDSLQMNYGAHSSLKEKTPLKQHNEKVNGKTVSNKSGAKPKIEDMFMKVLEDCQEKPEDETEAFLNHFGVLLRKLPVKIKDRYQRKFTRIVDDTLDELEDGEVDDEFQRRGFKITYD